MGVERIFGVLDGGCLDRSAPIRITRPDTGRPRSRTPLPRRYQPRGLSRVVMSFVDSLVRFCGDGEFPGEGAAAGCGDRLGVWRLGEESGAADAGQVHVPRTDQPRRRARATPTVGSTTVSAVPPPTSAAANGLGQLCFSVPLTLPVLVRQEPASRNLGRRIINGHLYTSERLLSPSSPAPACS